MSVWERRFEDVCVGQILTAQIVPVTTAVLVASSIAARDFHPLHHDSDFARLRGHPQMLLSGLVSAGFAQRFVTDWAGPDARLRRVRTRLDVPHYAGETLTLSGSVTARSRSENEDSWIEITVTGVNTRGRHLQSVIELGLRRGHGVP